MSDTTATVGDEVEDPLTGDTFEIAADNGFQLRLDPERGGYRHLRLWVDKREVEAGRYTLEGAA